MRQPRRKLGPFLATLEGWLEVEARAEAAQGQACVTHFHMVNIELRMLVNPRRQLTSISMDAAAPCQSVPAAPQP